MRTKLRLVVCFLALMTQLAYGQAPISSLVGREFSVHDDFAGQELAFKARGSSTCAIWRVLGSGRPVLSEVEYPLELKNENQGVFNVQLRDKSWGRMKIEIRGRSDVRLFLNGLGISITEKLNKSLQPTATAVTPPAAQEIVPAVAVAEH
jgi:hypothetical protein